MVKYLIYLAYLEVEDVLFSSLEENVHFLVLVSVVVFSLTIITINVFRFFSFFWMLQPTKLHVIC